MPEPVPVQAAGVLHSPPVVIHDGHHDALRHLLSC